MQWLFTILQPLLFLLLLLAVYAIARCVQNARWKGRCSKRYCKCLPSTPYEMETFTDRLIQVVAVKYLYLASLKHVCTF